MNCVHSILQRSQQHLWRAQADQHHPEETTDEVKRSLAGLGDRAPQGASAPPPHSGNSAGALHAPPCLRHPQSTLRQVGPQAQCPHQQPGGRRERGLAARWSPCCSWLAPSADTASQTQCLSITTPIDTACRGLQQLVDQLWTGQLLHICNRHRPHMQTGTGRGLALKPRPCQAPQGAEAWHLTCDAGWPAHRRTRP